MSGSDFGITVLILLNSVLFVNGAVFTSEDESRIEDFVESVMGCRNIPGISLSVVKGDETWARGYGVADIETGRRVGVNTEFLIGSLGKSFTMTLLGAVLQENGYNWDTKLSDIPDVNVQFVDKERTRELTVADLLSHRSGLSSVADYGFIAGYPDGTTQQTMSRRVKYLPATQTMRKGFNYNNYMYMVLGHVTETLGKDSWENLMTSRLLEPIGMRDSTLLNYSSDVLKTSSAKPYILKEGEIQPSTKGIYKLTPLEPAGCLLSTSLDMTTWMKFILNNATSRDGVAMMEPELFSQAFQEQFEFSSIASSVYSIKKPKFPVNDVTTGYGYAWFTATYRGRRKVWHSGGMFAYVSLVWLYPDENIGIFASTNGPGLPSTSVPGLNTIFYFLSDILLGLDPWLDPKTACSYPSPWSNVSAFPVPPQKEFTNDNVAEFVGTYGSHLLPDVTVSIETGNSSQCGVLQLEMNRIKGVLYPTQNSDNFNFQMSEPWEYAIERVFNENLTLRYPVEFIRSTGNGVIGFNISFEIAVIIPFRKDIRFADDVTAGAPSLLVSCILVVGVFCGTML